jgi:hypothetical protein
MFTLALTRVVLAVVDALSPDHAAPGDSAKPPAPRKEKEPPSEQRA